MSIPNNSPTSHPHQVYFSEWQLQILQRRAYHVPRPYRPICPDPIIRDDNIDMMSCCRTLGRKLEETLEQKNSSKFALLFAITCAITSALCGVLYRRCLAVLFAVLMTVFLIVTSWAYIFKLKRQHVEYILRNYQMLHFQHLMAQSNLERS